MLLYPPGSFLSYHTVFGMLLRILARSSKAPWCQFTTSVAFSTWFYCLHCCLGLSSVLYVLLCRDGGDCCPGTCNPAAGVSITIQPFLCSAVHDTAGQSVAMSAMTSIVCANSDEHKQDTYNTYIVILIYYQVCHQSAVKSHQHAAAGFGPTALPQLHGTW